MVPSLKQKLIPTVPEGFLYFSFIGFNVGNVTFLVPRPSEKVAEFAIGDAYVGRVYVAVNLPGYLTVRYLYFSQFIGHIGQLGDRCMMVQIYPFFNGKELEI